MMTKLYCRSALLLWLFLLTWARGEELSAPLKIVQPADLNSWRMISNETLTPNGQWLVYQLVPHYTIPAEAGGPVDVIVRATHGDVERRFPAGDVKDGAGGLQVSADGTRLGFVRAGKSGKVIVVVQIAAGAVQDFSGAEEFSFAGKDGEYIILNRAADQASKSRTLSVRGPDGRELWSLPAISSYSISPDGLTLAAAGEGSLIVRPLQVPGGPVHILPAGATITGWSWSPSGRALAAVATDTTGKTDILTVDGIATRKESLQFHGAKIREDLAGPVTFSPDLVWRADEMGVFFTFCRPTPPFHSRGMVAIWHSRAPSLPGEMSFARTLSGAMPRLGILFMADDRAVILNDGELRDVTPRVRGDCLLGYDPNAYGWRQSGNTRTQLRAYFLVEIATGRKTELIRDLRVNSTAGFLIPQLSPDGKWVVWRDNTGEFIVFEVGTRKKRSLTGDLPVRFYPPEDNPNTTDQLTELDTLGGVQAWIPERNEVLLSDGFDVWRVSLCGHVAKNLTRDGRANRICYRTSPLSLGQNNRDPLLRRVEMSRGAMMTGERTMAANRTWYFDRTEVDTGRVGLARLRRGEDAAQTLLSDEAKMWFLISADEKTVLMQRQTSVDCPDYHLLNEEWERVRALTDANPQRRMFRWPPPVRFLTYRGGHDQLLHSSLYLPAGYQPGVRYPVIVQIYHRLAQQPHFFELLETRLNPWLFRGYAVMYADIIPRINEPGPAAVEAVSAAIDAAVATGAVDRERVGLMGHSFGGFETYYIATRTSLAKAAAPYAGITNLLDWQLVNYGIGETPNLSRDGHDQPFIAVPFWDDLSATLGNSPLLSVAELKTPLLIAHGGRDKAVRFEQAEEFFSAARFAGNPNVVLLEYRNEAHDFEGAARADWNERMLQFFDHFLQGKPAPEWWANGVSVSN